MIAGLKKDGIFYFTLFGNNTDIKVPLQVTYQEMELFIDSMSQVKVCEKMTREGVGKNMEGEPIWSHVHTFIVKKVG